MDEAETMDKDLITAMFENGVTLRKEWKVCANHVWLTFCFTVVDGA
jgi:hypothetical protein